MITLIDKIHIIKLIEDGMSLRAVSKKTGWDRKTVTRYYKEHQKLNDKLTTATSAKEIRHIQNEIINKPKYSKRKTVDKKWTIEMEELVEYHLEREQDRNIKFGPNHKQHITIVMMHELLLQAGHEIGLTTVRNRMFKKREKLKEVFVRQVYEPGQRMEFDFGEVHLIINDIKQKYYLAVMSSPYSNYRTAYLYNNQGQKVFLDAHNRLFKEIGGVPQEMVYDNMRNVVTKFIGKSEKDLNQKLVQTAFYYGFDINVTNCFSGNEKGHVEGSVKFIRNKVFTTHYEFASFDEAEIHLSNRLVDLNTKATLSEETNHFGPLKDALDISEVRNQKVNKYSTVRIENNFYSVPETLVGKEIVVKNYIKDIEIFYNHKLACRHEKKDGELEYVIDITHFLQTFKRKPGALKNSEALHNNPKLKSIFENHYITQPKYFIELIEANKHKPKKELNSILLENFNPTAKSKVIQENIQDAINNQLDQYASLLTRRMN